MTLDTASALLARLARMPEDFRRRLGAIPGPRWERISESLVAFGWTASMFPFTSLPCDSVSIALAAAEVCGESKRAHVGYHPTFEAGCMRPEDVGEGHVVSRPVWRQAATSHEAALMLLSVACDVEAEWEATR